MLVSANLAYSIDRQERPGARRTIAVAALLSRAPNRAEFDLSDPNALAAALDRLEVDLEQIPLRFEHSRRGEVLSLCAVAFVAYFTSSKWAIHHKTLTFEDPARSDRPVTVDVAVRRDREMEAMADMIEL